MSRAPAVLSEVNGLAAASAAKRDEVLRTLGNEWRTLEVSVPQSVMAVQSRIDALAKSRHVPKDVDINTAKSSLAEASAAWDKAQSTFKSGNAPDAVDIAKDAKSKIDSAVVALKLELPQGH